MTFPLFASYTADYSFGFVSRRDPQTAAEVWTSSTYSGFIAHMRATADGHVVALHSHASNYQIVRKYDGETGALLWETTAHELDGDTDGMLNWGIQPSGAFVYCVLATTEYKPGPQHTETGYRVIVLDIETGAIQSASHKIVHIDEYPSISFALASAPDGDVYCAGAPDDQDSNKRAVYRWGSSGATIWKEDYFGPPAVTYDGAASDAQGRLYYLRSSFSFQGVSTRLVIHSPEGAQLVSTSFNWSTPDDQAVGLSLVPSSQEESEFDAVAVLYRIDSTGNAGLGVREVDGSWVASRDTGESTPHWSITVSASGDRVYHSGSPLALGWDGSLDSFGWEIQAEAEYGPDVQGRFIDAPSGGTVPYQFFWTRFRRTIEQMPQED